MSDKKELVLVCCSGGFDSSMTLSVLKLSGYENIIACHFDYGSRSADAEKMAITNVCKELDIDLRVFDISGIYSTIGIDGISMLQNVEAEIVTGTTKGLKTTSAWTPARNLLFLTIMGALGEAECMKHDYGKIYIAGGMLQLTESATYPDNTPYFVDAVCNALKYGTLIGNRFKPLYGLSNLMKTEQFYLMKEFGLENVYRHTISCDRAIVKTDHIRYGNNNDKPIACNCMKDGHAACGSGLLSEWAGKMLGFNDLEIRNFYEVDDINYVAHIPQHIKDKFTKTPDIDDIINRILLPLDKLDNLRGYIDGIRQDPI